MLLLEVFLLDCVLTLLCLYITFFVVKTATPSRFRPKNGFVPTKILRNRHSPFLSGRKHLKLNSLVKNFKIKILRKKLTFYNYFIFSDRWVSRNTEEKLLPGELFIDI